MTGVSSQSGQQPQPVFDELAIRQRFAGTLGTIGRRQNPTPALANGRHVQPDVLPPWEL
jgi:hypothetical protein